MKRKATRGLRTDQRVEEKRAPAICIRFHVGIKEENDHSMYVTTQHTTREKKNSLKVKITLPSPHTGQRV